MWDSDYIDMNLSELNVEVIQDELLNFVHILYKLLTESEVCFTGIGLSLVKKHSINLKTQGDLSFPNTVQPWKEFLLKLLKRKKITGETLLECIDRDISDLTSASKDWPISIVKALEFNKRVHLFLDRHSTIRFAFNNALNNCTVVLQRLSIDTTVVKIDPYCSKSTCLTFLRLKCLSEVVKNLYLIQSYPQIQSLIIVVTWRSTYDRSEFIFSSSEVQSVHCGVVLNAKTGLKETSVTASEYISQRQNELTLIAQHKYGVRVSKEGELKEFIEHLGESAATFELLQTKCSSSVKIHLDSTETSGSGGSSKGASFILYNCARLETMIRNFNEKVADGVYPALPSLEDTDLSLLTDEDEWSLIFIYIMGFPELLTSSVSVDLELTSKGISEDIFYNFRPHLVCNFLSKMVKMFSQYYRRVRILTQSKLVVTGDYLSNHRNSKFYIYSSTFEYFASAVQSICGAILYKNMEPSHILSKQSL